MRTYCAVRVAGGMSCIKQSIDSEYLNGGWLV